MNPTQHSTCNRVLTHATAKPLAITDAELEGEQCVVSFWLPDADELKLLQAGHPVAVFITGKTHPPIYLGVAARL